MYFKLNLKIIYVDTQLYGYNCNILTCVVLYRIICKVRRSCRTGWVDEIGLVSCLDLIQLVNCL